VFDFCGGRIAIYKFSKTVILAIDNAIPFWRRAFADLGELRPFNARTLSPDDVSGADALVVRSVSRVDAALLRGSGVRFVGTVTSGTDHIEADSLQSEGIVTASAPGSNANAVAEYIVSALLSAAEKRQWALSEKSLAVVGAGNVGSRVARKARALGMEVTLCDPPLRDATGDDQYRPLEEVLAADFVTFHVPLADSPPYRTRHMVDATLLARMSRHQVLLNSSRGAVFDGKAVLEALAEGRIGGVVLDVWEGEPRIDFSLLPLVEIGTPHIAGSSLDGKLRAAEMIRTRLCRFFSVEDSWDAQELYPQPRTLELRTSGSLQEIVHRAVVHAYDVRRDDERLRKLRGMQAREAEREFDRLRDEYPLRLEFCHYHIANADEVPAAASVLRSLGFTVRQADDLGRNERS
jgi:erythronate-4-phosphate dehydrogenase